MGTIKINKSYYPGSYLFDVDMDVFVEWLEKHLSEKLEQPVDVVEVRPFSGTWPIRVEANLGDPNGS